MELAQDRVQRRSLNPAVVFVIIIIIIIII
jgi:hypothetical protein